MVVDADNNSENYLVEWGWWDYYNYWQYLAVELTSSSSNAVMLSKPLSNFILYRIFMPRILLALRVQYAPRSFIGNL